MGGWVWETSSLYQANISSMLKIITNINKCLLQGKSRKYVPNLDTFCHRYGVRAVSGWPFYLPSSLLYHPAKPLEKLTSLKEPKRTAHPKCSSLTSTVSLQWLTDWQWVPRPKMSPPPVRRRRYTWKSGRGSGMSVHLRNSLGYGTVGDIWYPFSWAWRYSYTMKETGTGIHWVPMSVFCHYSAVMKSNSIIGRPQLRTKDWGWGKVKWSSRCLRTSNDVVAVLDLSLEII